MPMVIPFWRQIRWRLSLLFALLAVLPLALIELIVQPRLEEQAIQQVGAQLESVLQLKEQQIARWLADSGSALSALLSAPVLRQLEELRADPSPATQAAASELLADTVRRLAEQSPDSPPLRALFLYDGEGRVLAASDQRQLGQVVSRQPYFAASFTSDGVQPPFYAVGTAELTLVRTYRLSGSDGSTTVLAASLELGALGAIMRARSGLGETGETYLVSIENNYFLTPSRFEGYSPTRAYRSLGIERALNDERGYAGYDNYRTPPQPVLGAYRWLPALQAGLLAEIERDEALALSRSLSQLRVVLAFGLSVLAMLLGVATATWFTRPIHDLSQATARITAGALDQRAELRQRDELGTLATSFNVMADQLQRMLHGLEQRVAVRTGELERALNEREQTLGELREAMQARDELRDTVRELTNPVLPVHQGVLVMPLIGAIDSGRAELLIATLLAAVEQHRAQVVLIDVTGVPLVDTQVAAILIQATESSRLLGAEPVLVGIRPELAQTIVGLGLDLSNLRTLANLQSGITYALNHRRQR